MNKLEESQLSVDQPAVIRAFDDFRFIHVGNIANQAVEDVVDAYNPFDGTEFIHHKTAMYPCFLELLKDLVGFFITRDDVNLFDIFPEVEVRLFEHRNQEIFGINNPENMVEFFVAKRIYRMRIIGDDLYICVIGVFGIQPGDIVPVSHQCTDALIAQVKHAFHNILFDLLDLTDFRTFFQQGSYFFLRNL